jgi:DHA1 family bicyclomycin/chloramphenicol resistance-like MFS transporter
MATATPDVERTPTSIGSGEFIALMAAMTSLVALSTDAMLPALQTIGADLGVSEPNANQLIVSLLFYGLAFGQLLFGPLSDSVGRKPAIYAGYGLFIAGCLCSIFAGTFAVMLFGRLLQGVGVAGPRSVTLALVRDQYEGRAMARIMSFVMGVFILVPVIAPSLGQLILLFAGWRSIFGAFLVIAVITLAWFALRQPETLPPARRMPWSIGRVAGAFREVLSNRVTLGYTLAAGLISGAFLGYLNSAQQIFQLQYGLGPRFPIYFAVLALALGTASFLNGRLVMRYGMRRLAHSAALGQCALGVGFLAVALAMQGHPPLWLLTGYLMATFFCVGILFGNQNALAMEPLGHVAGVGAAVVGSLALLLATPLGMVIGQRYNGTVIPLVTGFAVLALIAFLTMRWAGASLEADADASA